MKQETDLSQINPSNCHKLFYRLTFNKSSFCFYRLHNLKLQLKILNSYLMNPLPLPWGYLSFLKLKILTNSCTSNHLCTGTNHTGVDQVEGRWSRCCMLEANPPTWINCRDIRLITFWYRVRVPVLPGPCWACRSWDSKKRVSKGIWLPLWLAHFSGPRRSWGGERRCHGCTIGDTECWEVRKIPEEWKKVRWVDGSRVVIIRARVRIFIAGRTGKGRGRRACMVGRCRADKGRWRSTKKLRWRTWAQVCWG